MEAHGVIGTQEEARAQAKMIDGVLLPLSSLKDLRAEVADAKPEKTTLTGNVTRGKPHLETIQLDGNEPEKITVLKCVALGYSIRETAELLERSIGTVQVRLRELEYEGLVENLKGAKGERIARGW